MESEKTTCRNRQYCIAFNCDNSNKRNPDLAFFSLPKDEERRREWLTSLKREDLLSKKGLKYKSYVVCSAHFDDSQIKIVKHIKTDAIPKVVDEDEAIQERDCAPKRKDDSSLSLLRNILLTVKPTFRSVKTQTDSTLDTHAAEYLADLRMMKRALQLEYSECKRRRVVRLQRSDVLVIGGGGGGGGGGEVGDAHHAATAVTVKVEKDLSENK